MKTNWICGFDSMALAADGIEISEVTVVTRAAGAAYRELEGKAFIVGAASNKMVMLNETGTAIWSYLDTSSTVEELAGKLAEEFEVDRKQALGDCISFLDALSERELIKLG